MGDPLWRRGDVIQVFLQPQHPTTKRFVREAEHVDDTEQSDDFSHVNGRIVRLTFVGQPAYSPVLAELARSFAVDYNILSGRIERIKDTALRANLPCRWTVPMMS